MKLVFPLVAMEFICELAASFFSHECTNRIGWNGDKASQVSLWHRFVDQFGCYVSGISPCGTADMLAGPRGGKGHWTRLGGSTEWTILFYFVVLKQKPVKIRAFVASFLATNAPMNFIYYSQFTVGLKSANTPAGFSRCVQTCKAQICCS